jgi:bacterioferritin (cytochrome b1)
MIAERIVQLGGAPNFSPEGLAMRSHSQYVEGTTLVDMIRERSGGRTHRNRFLQRNHSLSGHQ